jgi:hypothetical protein
MELEFGGYNWPFITLKHLRYPSSYSLPRSDSCSEPRFHFFQPLLHVPLPADPWDQPSDKDDGSDGRDRSTTWTPGRELPMQGSDAHLMITAREQPLQSTTTETSCRSVSTFCSCVISPTLMPVTYELSGSHSGRAAVLM